MYPRSIVMADQDSTLARWSSARACVLERLLVSETGQVLARRVDRRACRPPHIGGCFDHDSGARPAVAGDVLHVGAPNPLLLGMLDLGDGTARFHGPLGIAAVQAKPDSPRLDAGASTSKTEVEAFSA